MKWAVTGDLCELRWESASVKRETDRLAVCMGSSALFVRVSGLWGALSGRAFVDVMPKLQALVAVVSSLSEEASA